MIPSGQGGAGNSLQNFMEYLIKAHTASYGGEVADTVLRLIWPENEQTKHYQPHLRQNLRQEDHSWGTNSVFKIWRWEQ